MKKETNVMYVVRLTVTLLLICLVMAAGLAAVNSITEPIIAQLTYEKTQKAIEAVLPGGGDAIDVPAVDVGVSIFNVYQGENGYAVEVGPGGFDNTITMMVGIDNDGNVLGIDIISHTETAGLGAVADADTAAGQAFRDQFVGMSGTVSVDKDGGEVDSLTGATITSRAICDGVNAALKIVKEIG